MGGLKVLAGATDAILPVQGIAKLQHSFAASGLVNGLVVRREEYWKQWVPAEMAGRRMDVIVLVTSVSMNPISPHCSEGTDVEELDAYLALAPLLDGSLLVADIALRPDAAPVDRSRDFVKMLTGYAEVSSLSSLREADLVFPAALAEMLLPSSMLQYEVDPGFCYKVLDPAHPALTSSLGRLLCGATAAETNTNPELNKHCFLKMDSF